MTARRLIKPILPFLSLQQTSRPSRMGSRAPTPSVYTANPGVVIDRSFSPRQRISTASNFSSELCVVRFRAGTLESSCGCGCCGCGRGNGGCKLGTVIRFEDIGARLQSCGYVGCTCCCSRYSQHTAVWDWDRNAPGTANILLSGIGIVPHQVQPTYCCPGLEHYCTGYSQHPKPDTANIMLSGVGTVLHQVQPTYCCSVLGPC